MRWWLPKCPQVQALLLVTCSTLLQLQPVSGNDGWLKDECTDARLRSDGAACEHLQTAVSDNAWLEDEASQLLQKRAQKLSHHRSSVASADLTGHGLPTPNQTRNEKLTAWKAKIATSLIWFGIAFVLSHMTASCLGKVQDGTGRYAKAAPESADSSGAHSGTECAVQEHSSSDQTYSFLSELCLLLPMAGPLALSHTSKILQETGTDVLLGHKNTTVLAGVAQALVCTNLFEQMSVGGISQLAMLCGQAHGAKQHRLVGVWLQMMLILACVLFIPAACFRLLTKTILLAAGEPEDLANAAGTFAVWSMPIFLMDKWYLCVKEFYASQGIVWPELMVNIVSVFAALANVYIFVFVFDLGAKGAAIALTITRACRLLLYVAFCYWCGYHRKSWHGWSWAEVTQRDRWRTLLSLVLPSATGVLFELVVVSVASLSVGQLGTATSAAFQLACQIMFFSMVFANGIADATGIRMSQYLGSNQPNKARSATHIGIGICTLSGLALGVSFWTFGDSIAALLSNDPAVQEQLVSNRDRIAAFIWFVGMQFSSSILLYMQGRGWLVTTITPLCTWLVGLPLILYCSKKQGLPGVFFGLNSGYGLSACCLTVLLLRCDWNQLASDALERSEMKEGASKEATPSEANAAED